MTFGLLKAALDPQDARRHHEALNRELSEHYSAALHRWLVGLFPGVSQVALVLFTTNPETAAARVGAISPDPLALIGLEQTLSDLYRDAYFGGVGRSHPALGLWPSGESGLDELEAGGPQLALDLAATLQGRIEGAVERAVTEGWAREELEARLRHTVAIHFQGKTVATTEGARGQVAATLDAMRRAGATRFEVMADAKPCLVCAVAASMTHEVGAATPPFHPQCECTIVPA